jgi:hypothetical protein
MDKEKKLMNRPIKEGTKILNEALVLFDETPALKGALVLGGSKCYFSDLFKRRLLKQISRTNHRFFFSSIKKTKDPQTT